MINWDDFRARVRRFKAERWPDILASEPRGRAAGRRPRDPELEALLSEADRLRVAQSGLLSKARRLPPRPSGRPEDAGPSS